MSSESELRSVADAIAECRKRLQVSGALDSETDRTLNWASMQTHYIAHQLRGMCEVLVATQPATAGSKLAREVAQGLLEDQRREDAKKQRRED
jgi:hypothetical protein